MSYGDERRGSAGAGIALIVVAVVLAVVLLVGGVLVVGGLFFFALEKPSAPARRPAPAAALQESNHGVSGSSTSLGFIRREGRHVISAKPAVWVEVHSDAGGLHYRIGHPFGEVGPCSQPFAEQGAPWFLYVESPDSYWVFDGKDDVTLLEFTEPAPNDRTIKQSSLALARKRLTSLMPAKVKKALPDLCLGQRGAPDD